jgi:hypothetical protein
MSTDGTLRRTGPARGIWVDLDPATRCDGPLFLDASRAEEVRRLDEAVEEALAAEAARTGMLIAISLPAGVLVTWLFDCLTGGPGLTAMVGL